MRQGLFATFIFGILFIVSSRAIWLDMDQIRGNKIGSKTTRRTLIVAAFS
jgi:hypothetical protein